LVNAAILRTSLQQGGTAGFLLAAVSSLGDLIYFTLAVSGAAGVFGWMPLRWALWLAGTGVLLVLAWRNAQGGGPAAADLPRMPACPQRSAVHPDHHRRRPGAGLPERDSRVRSRA